MKEDAIFTIKVLWSERQGESVLMCDFLLELSWIETVCDGHDMYHFDVETQSFPHQNRKLN